MWNYAITAPKAARNGWAGSQSFDICGTQVWLDSRCPNMALSWLRWTCALLMLSLNELTRSMQIQKFGTGHDFPIERNERLKSYWASLTVLQPGNDGSLRYCMNYRKRNAVAIKYTYQIPLHGRVSRLATRSMDILDIEFQLWILENQYRRMRQR